jgi:hypothetical protein
MRHQHALIAQAKFAAESSGQFDQDLVPRLCGYLHSLPKYKFGDGLGLKGNYSFLLCELEIILFVTACRLLRKRTYFQTYFPQASLLPTTLRPASSPISSLSLIRDPRLVRIFSNLSGHTSTSSPRLSSPTAVRAIDIIFYYPSRPCFYILTHYLASCLNNIADKVCEFVLPSLNGLLTALESSKFEFESRDFADLISHSNALLSNSTSEQIRKAIDTITQEPSTTYARRVLAIYARDNILLSSNRVVLQVLTVKRNMIARLIEANTAKVQLTEEQTVDANVEALALEGKARHTLEYSSEDEKPSVHAEVAVKPSTTAAQSFEAIWTALLSKAFKRTAIAGQTDLTKVLRTEYIMSLQFLSDMRMFANDLLAKGSVSSEFYYREIMSVALVNTVLVAQYFFPRKPLLPGLVSTNYIFSLLLIAIGGSCQCLHSRTGRCPPYTYLQQPVHSDPY